MKKNIFNAAMLLAGVCLAFSVKAQTPQDYVIKGKIDSLKEPMKLHFVYYPSKTESVRDSVMVTDGTFELKGKISHAYRVSISLTPPDYKPEKLIIGQRVTYMPDACSFYLSPGTTTISGKKLFNAVVHNPVQDEYAALQEQIKPLQTQVNAVNLAIYKTKNEDSITMLKGKKTYLFQQYYPIYTAFIKAHPDSYVSFDLVKNYGVVIQDPDSFSDMFNALSPEFRNSPEGVKIATSLQLVRKYAIGQPAIDFTQADVDGKPVTLSSLKGKYVLIDFWASWCGWCRLEYPYLRQAYAQYKSKNFEIIGVSLDDKRDLWVKAIKENKFEWPEICDLKGKNNEVAQKYGVYAIPQCFLIDPNGVIIAKNMRGDELAAKLKEVLDAKNQN